MRLILADDAVLFREALAAGLTARGHDVIGQAADAVVLLAMVGDLEPDVAIVDIRMPPNHESEGLDAALAIRASHRRTAVLLLSQYVETAEVAQLLGDDPGGVGYLLKDRGADLGELDAAIRRVGAGGSVIDPASRRRPPRTPPPTQSARRAHSPRAGGARGLMAEGRTNRAIAAMLSLTVKTVEGHVAMIFSKLALEATDDDNRRVLAVITYLRDPDTLPARS